MLRIQLFTNTKCKIFKTYVLKIRKRKFYSLANKKCQNVRKNFLEN